MAPEPANVLIVAFRTAATAALVEAVRERAHERPCRFTLVVPKPYWDPYTEEAEAVIELAVPLLDEASGTHVHAVIGPEDPFEAVRQVVDAGDVDEIIVSTLPARISRWLRRDLPTRLESLGLPVTVVTARESARELTGPH